MHGPENEIQIFAQFLLLAHSINIGAGLISPENLDKHCVISEGQPSEKILYIASFVTFQDMRH